MPPHNLLSLLRLLTFIALFSNFNLAWAYDDEDKKWFNDTLFDDITSLVVYNSMCSGALEITNPYISSQHRLSRDQIAMILIALLDEISNGSKTENIITFYANFVNGVINSSERKAFEQTQEYGPDYNIKDLNNAISTNSTDIKTGHQVAPFPSWVKNCNTLLKYTESIAINPAHLWQRHGKPINYISTQELPKKIEKFKKELK